MRNKGRSLLVAVILISIVALIIIAGTIVSFIKRAEPQPRDATEAIVKAFEQNQIVALGDVHGLDQERAFLISLIKNPTFAPIVQTIVIETGNARYQQLVDDYLNGKNIDIQELSSVWRDLSVSGMGPTDTMSDADLFQAIRAVNQKLTPSTRLHVYLGDRY